MFSTKLVSNKSRLASLISVLALSITLAACGGGETDTAGEGTDGSATDVAATTELDLDGNVTLNGAGASFPALLYQRWFKDINAKYPNLKVNYQSVGSGAGVRQFLKGTVDFGASDVAMKDEEIAQVDRGVLLLPMTGGSVVFAYNLDGVNELKLSREVYADILLGKITNWNDA